MRPNIVMSVTASVLLMQLAWSSFSHAAPTSITSKPTVVKDSATSQVTDEEQQLETLKNQAKTHDDIAVVKSEVQASTNVNGQKSSFMETETKVQDARNGQMLASRKQETVETQKEGGAKPDKIVKTVVDIPNKGIHQTNINHNGKEISESKEMNEDYYTPLEGIQYSPIDMAEYIYRTGDEDGVTLAIEELMRERLLSQEDAINYLEEVKMNLDILRAQGEQANRIRAIAARREMLSNQESREQKFRERSSQFGINHRLQADSIEISSGESKRMSSAISSRQPSFHKTGLFNEEETYEANINPEIDYDEILGRGRLADFLSKEFSLEEVIYQLAKQMFTQSVMRGNNDAEEALQRFTLFLQEETARGRISPALQRKVINALLAALMDTVGDHPEYAALQQANPVINSELKSQNLNDNSKSPKSFSTLNSKRETESQMTQEKRLDTKAETNSPVEKSITKNANA